LGRPRNYNPGQREDRGINESVTKRPDYASERKQERRQLLRKRFWSSYSGDGGGPLRDLYNQLDEDGDGEVSYKEFSQGLAKMGLGFLVEDGEHLFF